MITPPIHRPLSMLASITAILTIAPLQATHAAQYRDFWRSGPTPQEELLAVSICKLTRELPYYEAFHELSLVGNVIPEWVKNLHVGDPVLIGNAFFNLLAGTGEETMIEYSGPVGVLASVGIGTVSASQERDRIRKQVLPDYYFVGHAYLEKRADHSRPIDMTGERQEREDLVVKVLQNHERYDALIERVDEAQLRFVSETAKGEIKDELRIDELKAILPLCGMIAPSNAAEPTPSP